MNNKGNRKIRVAAGLVLLLAMVALWGCGGKSKEALLADMKEFSTPDGSAFLYLDKNWTEEDLQIDTFLTAGSANGNDAVFLFQFPKPGTYQVNSMDALKSFMDQGYHIEDEKAAEAFEIPGMSNVEASTCKLTVGTDSVQAYLVYGETDYAYYALGYVSTKMNDTRMKSFQASCSKFREEVPEIEDWTTVEMSDTVRWFNASYAVLTEINGWDYNRFAGLPANEESMALEQQSLKEWWGVEDRATADETLEWVLTEGHRADFVDNMSYLEELGLGEVAADERVQAMLDSFELDEESAGLYVDWYGMYEEYGEDAITGWDYCRALNLVSFYYLAGYYTEQEALDKSLEIAQIMQPMFESWDDLVDSYLRGYEYWAEESSEARREIYEDLKSRADNPYQVDYHTTLTKTW